MAIEYSLPLISVNNI